MDLKKSDMAFDYIWSADPDNYNPKHTDKPDDPELDRAEGYEMLYFATELPNTLTGAIIYP